MIPDNIPDELKGYDQWVVWKYDKLRKNGKRSKVPYDIKTGIKANALDTNIHVPFTAAITAYQSGTYDGIGMVVTKDDPYVFIDVDDCFKSEEYKTKYIEFIKNELQNSYVELSPSKGGFHAIVKGRLNLIDGQKHTGKFDSGIGIEVYDDKHFFTFTGQSIFTNSKDVKIHGKQAVVDGFINLLNNNSEGSKPQQNQTSSAPECLQGRYKRLWNGDASYYNHDRSSGLLALCQLLIINKYDTEDKLFDIIQTSPLYNSGDKSEADKVRQLRTEIITKALSTKYIRQEKVKPKTTSEAYHMKFKKKGYAIPGMVPVGLSLLAARPKIGKTELMVNAAIQAATQQDIFHSIPTKKYKVLYYFLEGGLADAINKVRCLQEYTPDLDNLTFQTFDNGGLRGMYKGGLTDIVEWLEDNKDHPTWIIIDTLQAFQPDDGKKKGNEYAKTYDAMRTLQSIAYNHDASITLVTHLNKDTTRASDVTQMIMGSTAGPGASDASMLLLRDRNQSEAILQVVGRNGVDEKKYKLTGKIVRAEAVTESGEIEEIKAVDWTLLGEVTVEEEEAKKKASRRKTQKEIIYELLPDEEITVKEIIKLASGMGIAEQRVRNNLSTLKREGFISITDEGYKKIK